MLHLELELKEQYQNKNISRCVLRERVMSELFTLKLNGEQETEADLTGM